MISELLIAMAMVFITHAAIDMHSSSNNHHPKGGRNQVNDMDEVSLFNCKDKPRVSRFPHPKDSTKFIYCVSGTPHSAKCWPQGTRFNPTTTRSDLPPHSPPPPPPEPTIPPVPSIELPPPPPQQITHTNISNGDHPPNDKGPTRPDITTPTTPPPPPPPPTLKPPRLMDAFSFSLDCGATHPCGLYPNHQGNCSTFYLCTETARPPILKRCHGGQHFDQMTQECRPPEEAECWEEPHNGPTPPTNPIPSDLCPPHPYNSSLEVDDKVRVLSTPNITNWGEWQAPLFCPGGSFISGINVWRRVLQVGPKTDQGGLVSLGVQCQTPEGVITKVLESVAPGAPNDGFTSFYSCSSSGGGGVAVGFNANIQSIQPLGGDNLATDNIQLACSCGLPAYKPYENIPGLQSGHRGEWIGVQSCGPREALCGFQTQMADYKQVLAQYDNTGLNNLRMFCCPVPDPVESCTPSEQLMPIRSCVNNEGIYPSRCDFKFIQGTGFDYQNPNPGTIYAINFHQSLGHNILSPDQINAIKRKFELGDGTTQDLGKEYSWKESDSVAEIWTMANQTPRVLQRSIYLPINTSEELYQIVGSCAPFIIRTNRFLRIRTELGSGNMTKTRMYFDV